MSFELFSLDKNFVNSYATKKPPFGFNGLGEMVYLRTYSRLKDDGTQEAWFETVERVVNGTYRMQQRHIEKNSLGWDAEVAQESAQEMYDRMWNMKFLPPGRGLWAMGTALTEERELFSALNNCAYVSTVNLKKDLHEPFTFLMDASMLGVGVGFDTKGAGQIKLHIPKPVEDTFVIPDDREGWVMSLQLLLLSFFKPNMNTVLFDYSLVRPAGLPIKGFGGISSGPEPLRNMLEKIREILLAGASVGRNISVTDIVDIMNLIGKCVVAGNVRRCLPVGTLVHTNNGLVKIEDIKEGMMAKTSNGYARISELVHQGEQYVSTIKTQLGEFKATRKHKIAVMDGIGSYTWKPLEDVVVGDRLVFVSTETTGTTSSLPTWEYNKPTNSTTCRDITIPELDPDMAWFIGLLHGDGYVFANRKNNGANAYIAIACDSTNQKIIDRAAEQLARFGVNVDVTAKKGENCTLVRATSKQLAWYLDQHVKQPKTTIKIPEWILSASVDVRAAYVAGVFDADGTQDKPLKVVQSIYPEFVEELQAVVASVGIPSRSCVSRLQIGNWKTQYTLSVVGEKAVASWNALIAPYSSKYVLVSGRKRSQNDFGYPKEWVSQINYGRNWSASSRQMTVATAERCGVPTQTLIPVEVLSVEHDTEFVDTYDISVPGPNEFVAQEGLLVHNTAEIAFGEYDDQEFIDLKNAAVNPERNDWNSGWAWTSNNSIFAKIGMDYTDVAKRVALNGEPGFAWLDNMQAFSRMNGKRDNKDHKATGGNPCLEQTLESYELCCLVETFPARHDTLDDYLRTLKYAYLYAKTVTLGKTHWPKTNKVLLRNRRIGLSQSGIQQAIAKFGIEAYRILCETGYDTVQHYDKVYSDWFAIPRSIKTTSVKPSGSVSLLAGATPGMHWPESKTYIRRMRLSKISDLVPAFVDAGYRVEDAKGDESSVVVEIPVEIEEDIRTVSEVSIWEQFAMAAFMQRHWADNQVSCTVTFDPATEANQIAPALDYYQYQLKGISLLPRVDYGAYPQMPYEAIDRETYETMKAKIRPIEFGKTQEESTSERFCDGDSCIIL